MGREGGAAGDGEVGMDASSGDDEVEDAWDGAGGC